MTGAGATAALTHLALHVRDVDACVAFYRDYCGLHPIHERADNKAGKGVWLCEPGREFELTIVLIAGGAGHDQREGDYSHLGFALESREAVDAIAARASTEGRLAWPPREEPPPVGYYCGVRDPDGHMVEFSFGQPLGPGHDAAGSER